MKRPAWLWPCLYVLACGLVALVHNNAVAQPAPWPQLDERCASEPILRTTGKINPACKRRDDLSLSLIRQGWLPCAHGLAVRLWETRIQTAAIRPSTKGNGLTQIKLAD